MNSYVALLRAVNVGGRKLLMADLKALAEKVGLQEPRTYIASGNLLFRSGKAEAELRSLLEREIKAHLGKPTDVLIRTAAELGEVVKDNPFANEPGNRVVAIFLDEKPPQELEAKITNITDERIALGRREIYVHYPNGMGRSKVRIPAAASGTARNMNTVAKLAQLAKETV